MSKLGTWPQEIHYLSWVSQRIANRAPEWTTARRYSWSVLQQLLNPLSLEIEKSIKELAEERQNMFTGSANIKLADMIYSFSLGTGMNFSIQSDNDGVILYDQPTVYATIDDTEFELSIAEKNNLESLFYTAIPSRLEDNEESYEYLDVVSRIAISELANVIPGEISIPGHLYISIYNNTTWETEGKNKIYFPKVYLTGTTSKGTRHTEVIPIKYNGSFKTMYQWKLIETVETSYLDSTAEIEIKCAPCPINEKQDNRNIIVNPNGIESIRFLSLGSSSRGSLLVSEGFTVQDENTIRYGFENLDYYSKVELQDSNSSPITINDFVCKPNSDYIYAIDDNNLYVYSSKIPYPNTKILDRENPDTKMDLYSDRWMYSPDDTISIKTDIIDIVNVPYKFRWSLTSTDGTIQYLNADGSIGDENSWILNIQWERGLWSEKIMTLYASTPGTYILSLECLYSNLSDAETNYTLVSRFLFYIPSVIPEITIPLPSNLKQSSYISFDSNECLWLIKDSVLYKVNLFYDYYVIDYSNKSILFREQYSQVRVCV